LSVLERRLAILQELGATLVCRKRLGNGNCPLSMVATMVSSSASAVSKLAGAGAVLDAVLDIVLVGAARSRASLSVLRDVLEKRSRIPHLHIAAMMRKAKCGVPQRLIHDINF